MRVGVREREWGGGVGGTKPRTLPLSSEAELVMRLMRFFLSGSGTHGSNFGPYFLLPKANRRDQPLPGRRPEVKPPLPSHTINMTK